MIVVVLLGAILIDWLMPNKRHAVSSPPPSLLAPAAKRSRIGGDGGVSTKTAVLDSFPTIEEIVHHIFSYLDAEDLCTIQRELYPLLLKDAVSKRITI